jgi:hypothetical protein
VDLIPSTSSIASKIGNKLTQIFSPRREKSKDPPEPTTVVRSQRIAEQRAAGFKPQYTFKRQYKKQ